MLQIMTVVARFFFFSRCRFCGPRFLTCAVALADRRERGSQSAEKITRKFSSWQWRFSILQAMMMVLWGWWVSKSKLLCHLVRRAQSTPLLQSLLKWMLWLYKVRTICAMPFVPIELWLFSSLPSGSKWRVCCSVEQGAGNMISKAILQTAACFTSSESSWKPASCPGHMDGRSAHPSVPFRQAM